MIKGMEEVKGYKCLICEGPMYRQGSELACYCGQKDRTTFIPDGDRVVQTSVSLDGMRRIVASVPKYCESCDDCGHD